MSPFYVAVFRLFNLLFLGVSFLPTPLRLFLPCFADLLLACFADLSYFSIPLLLFHFTLLARFLPRVARFVGNTGIKKKKKKMVEFITSQTIMVNNAQIYFSFKDKGKEMRL
jgi:hypothetical protein